MCRNIHNRFTLQLNFNNQWGKNNASTFLDTLLVTKQSLCSIWIFLHWKRVVLSILLITLSMRNVENNSFDYTSDESSPWITIRKIYWKSWSYPHILPKDAYLSMSNQSLQLLKCHFSIQNPEFRTSPEYFNQCYTVGMQRASRACARTILNFDYTYATYRPI